MVQLLTEHDVADIVEHHNAQQGTSTIHHGEHVSARLGNDLHHGTQIHIGLHLLEIGFHHALDVHQGKHRLVLVMGEQLPFLGQTHGVDAMRFEDLDGEIGAYRHHHQRKEEAVSTRKFGNEEHPRKRCVHDARHHSRHAHQGKILFGQIVRHNRCKAIAIAEMRKDKPRDTSQEQAWSKGTPASATAIGSRSGKHLEQDNERQIEQQESTVSVEDGVVHHRIPFRIVGSVQEQGDGIVPFTVKRREKENEGTQTDTPQHQFGIRIAISPEDVLEPVHGTGEVQGNKSAKDTEQHHRRNTLHEERLVHIELEHGFGTRQNIRYGSRRYTRHQQREQRTHGKVDHQHFKHEHQAGNRSLENARNGTRGTTSHKEHQCAVFQAENAPQVRADGRTGQHNRCFRPYRSTETDGDGTGYQRRPGVVTLDTALPARNGVQNLRHTMTDVVPHNATDEQPRKENTDDRIHQVHPVRTGYIKVVGQEFLDPFYQMLQQACRQCRQDTHHKAQYQNELLQVDPLLAPFVEALQKTFLLFRKNTHLSLLRIYSLIILMTPPLPNFNMLEGLAPAGSSCLYPTI